MLIPSSTIFTPIARASQARVLEARTLIPTGVALLRHCHVSQQARPFWSSLWPSNLDPQASTELEAHRRSILRARVRSFKALNNQLCREMNRNMWFGNRAESYRASSSHKSGGSPAGWRAHCRQQKRGDTGFPNTEPGPRPGRNIEDVERTAMNRLLWQPFMDAGTLRDPLKNIRRYLDEQHNAVFGASQGSGASTGSSKGLSPTKSESSVEYVIDPITNRKMPRQPSSSDNGVNIPVNTYRRAKSSKEDSPVFPDGVPPVDELEQYRDVKIDIPSYNEELIHRVNDLPPKKPQGVPPEPPQPATKAPDPPAEIVDELKQYEKVDINYPPSMNEELIHRVGDLPNGNKPATRPKTDTKCSAAELSEYVPFVGPEESIGESAGAPLSRSWPSRIRPLVESTAEGTSKPKKFYGSHPSRAPLSQSMPETAMFDYDPYSKEPTGLEKSWAEECRIDPKADKMYTHHYAADGSSTVVGPKETVAPTETSSKLPTESLSTEAEPQTLPRDLHNSCQDRYGTAGFTLEKEIRAKSSGMAEEAASAASAASTSTEVGGKGTLYRILAYDPTMQMINVAETTSVVQDSATPLSPAEVMLRLSNPSKFFPHFGPLQAEGFEIVSGSGDVMVFKKVRDAVDLAAATVNPIDMMGRRAIPNVGNFASPTGFVNYESHLDEEDVARNKKTATGTPADESMMAGAVAAQQMPELEAHQKGKKGFMRKTATGVVWVAGIAYGVGAASEFAKGRENVGTKMKPPQL